MKVMFKRPRQDLSIKVDRYEFTLGIIILFVSRHISPSKRFPLFLQLLIWRFYHAFMTFSTDSTPGFTGRGDLSALLCKPMLYDCGYQIKATDSTFHGILPNY
jgi:hypothetical protein